MLKAKRTNGYSYSVRQRLIGLLLTAAFTLSLVQPFALPTLAEDFYFGQNTLDTSNGNPADDWLNVFDPRYSGYGATFTLGAQTTPYILKTGDELYSLSRKVNGGESFDGQYLDAQGLSAAEAAAAGGAYTTPHVLDLRMYDGSAQSAGATNLWAPIGQTESTPFKGHFYSSTSASIINVSYPYTSQHPYTGTVYGLFGYNDGSLGVEGGFQVSAIHIATQSGNPVDLDFTANASTVATVGGVAAVNMPNGVIANVRFGVGTNYDVDAGQIIENGTLENAISLPLNKNAALTVGGVTGYNQGSVKDCSFTGRIHSLGETGTGTGFDKVNGIGSIAGFSSGRLEGCVSDGMVTLDSAQAFIKVGGIVGGLYSAAGDNIHAVVVSCVYTGSLSVNTTPAAASAKLQNSVGGIAGAGYNATLEQCVTGADVVYVCAGGETGRTGGIIGTAMQKTTITECFGTGRVRGGGYTGGLAGALYNTSSVKDSYYTGTVESLGYTLSEESKFGLSANNGVSAAGGLVGSDQAGTASFVSVSGAYFAGSTLNADIGSLIGETGATPSSSVYYDSQVSPNAAVPALGVTSHARTTAALQTTTVSNAFITGSSSYPRLAWAEVLDASTDFGRLVKALSVIASKPYLTMDGTNSFSNEASAYNAYQVKEASLSAGLLAADIDGGAALGIVPSGWTAAYTYRGGYAPAASLGALYTNEMTVSAGRYTARVTLCRKLLSAVNQTEGAARSITDVSTFQRMLDMANFASGGYVGGVFRLEADIDTLTLSSVKDTADPYRDRPANYFCAEFDGNGKTIAALRLESGTQALFRVGFHANVHHLNVTTVTAGTVDSPVDFTEPDTGVLFAKSAYTAFDSLSFGSVNLYANLTVANMNIGVLSGVCLLGGNTLTNITFGSADVQIPVTMMGYGYGLATANISGAGSRIDTVSVTDSYNLRLSRYSTITNPDNKAKDNNKLRYAGGLFGTVAATVTLTDASVNDLYANIDAYEATAGRGLFGGIGGRVDSYVSNCTVTGKIIGSVGGANTNLVTIGGIVGAPGSGSKTYTNCHFTGELDGTVAGGIVSAADYGSKFESCSVTAAINADAAVGAKKLVAGGITGQNTNSGITFNNCYFFGSVTANDAGGLVGTAKANTFQNCYARAIVNSTDAAGTAGGLVGSAAGAVLTVKNSYFTGQLGGDGSKGGIAGKASEKSVFTNVYFDRSIAGSAIPTVASVTQAQPDTGSALDAKCAVTTADIKASGLSSSFVAETDTQYPQLAVHAGGSAAQKQSSADSTGKVFQPTKADSTLTSLPDFDLAAGGDAYTVERQTAATDTLKPWDDVLTYTQEGDAPYGHYAIKAVGSTQFTVKFAHFLPGKTLDLAYSVRVKPFDYGEGTADDPFIIYDTDELVKFRDYLKNGFDTALQYYKIGSLEAGNPSITLDLSGFDDWEPIINLAGHLDGNGSLIQHITCKQGYRKFDDSGLKVTETYYGFFGSTTDTGEIQDLTLDDVSIETQNAFSVRAGALIGISAGGSYTNVAATNVVIDTGSASSPHVGGLVGLVQMDAGRRFALNQGMVYATITGTGTGGSCGGLIGSGEGSNAAITLADSAAYGTISGYTNLGGIAGRVNGPDLAIDRCVSTVDLTGTQDGSACIIGGLIGNSASAGIHYSLKDSLYGGRISYTEGPAHALGGLVGHSTVYKDFMNAYTFPSEAEIVFIREGLYADEQALRNDVYTSVIQTVDNCYYNSNINPYPTSAVALKGRFMCVNPGTGGNMLTEKTYDGPLPEVLSGKSDTFTMSGGSLTLGGSFTQESGYYPRPAWTGANTDDAGTDRNEVYLSDVSRFYSLALYYTNAGRFGDDGFSNLFVTAGNIALQSGAGDGSLVKTANGTMLQSTGEGAATAVTVSADYPSGTFTRRVAFTPSVVSCGVADYSYYFANSQGMWVTQRAEAGGIQVAYPWTLYTADQLQGLTNLLALQADGNGLKVDTLNYVVTPPADTQLGDTFVMGADIDGGEAYKNGFKPICPDSAAPFNTTFNGLGHTIAGLYLNSSAASPALGLFGVVENGEISNVGLTSGQILVDDSITHAGGIAARLGANASISGCFSALPVVTSPGKTTPSVMGGLAGDAVSDSASIRNSFTTGFLYSACSGDTAGGIIGDAAGASLSGCYTAAYIEATVSGVLYGRGTGAVENGYYDIGACGDMKNTNGAASKIPTAANLGRGFADVEGLYPLPVMFTQALTGAVKAAAIPVSLTNARSVTSGRIDYPSAQLIYQNGYAGHAFTGTVGSGDTVYDEATPFTSFDKNNTGLVVLKVVYEGRTRPVLANLQCWYDYGLDSHRFVINTAKELAEFAAIVNGTLTADNNPNGRHEHTNITNPSFEGWTVALGSDIDLSVLSGWTPIGAASTPFKGTFDGDGHVLSGMNITAANADGHAALFGTAENTVLTNIGLNDGRVDNASGTAAALAAHAKGTTEISRCFSNVTVSGEAAAGICGVADAAVQIRECYNMGLVSGSRLAAGITAQNGGSIENSYNTGVIRSTTATSAGIAAQNDGRITGCYNAAYIEGASLSPIATAGTITGCGYDPKLLTYDGQVAGVAKSIDFAAGSVWNAADSTHYPELSGFRESSSAAFQDASELSVLKMDFGSGRYLEFVSAVCAGRIKTDGTDIDVSVSSEGNLFSVTRNGDRWTIEPSKTGGGYIVASVSGASAFTHRYYAVAVMLMKIRYEFDFGPLFGGNPAKNPQYHTTPATASTWADNDGTTFIISTPEDFLSFAAYVAAGNTTAGKTFKLDYPLDMDGRSMAPIGTESTPFMGVFEGGGYTVSNLNITGTGRAALFDTIGTSGKIRNLMLDYFTVTAQKTNTAMAASCIAAANNGSIANVGITNGLLTANNASSSQDTYLGVFAAENAGTIRGCYFIQNRSNLYGIVHYSLSSQYVGGMVGDNQGTLAGCYLISDMYTANIKAIAGSNGGKTDTILNCYFNIKGTTKPVNLQYAYDTVNYAPYFVPESDMKQAEFAKWLSSNIYAGTFKTGSVGDFDGTADTTLINDGLPYLTGTQLVKYDLGRYFPLSRSMMLSIWNVEESGASSFLNGVFALDDLDFKYFKSVVTHQLLRFDMSILPADIGYEISSRVYGVAASYNDDVENGSLGSAQTNVKDHPITADSQPYEIAVDATGINEPNLIVVTIKLKKAADINPWGVYREWAAP